MTDELRKPLFFVALALLCVAFLLEVGSASDLLVAGDVAGDYAGVEGPAPGVGIPYLALIDGFLLFTVGLIGLSMLVPERVHGRIQGVATFVVSLSGLIATVILVIAAVQLLVLMVSLLTALPFGPPIYAGMFGSFDVTSASAVLSLSTMLKLGAGGCLVLAHQRFVQNRGLVLLAATSLVANLLVGFLQGLPPQLLVSVTDAVAAVVVGVLGAIWAVVLLVGSVPAVVKAIA